MIGRVRVEGALDEACGDAQGVPARGRLDGLEVEAIGGAWPYERPEFGREFPLEGLLEPPLSPPSVPSSASAQRSQAPQ
jgi:hypothetical protein